MKFYKSKNQLLVMWMAAGFFVGILYENMISRSNGITMELFQTYFLKQFAQVEIITEEYIWYVAKVRLIPFFLLCMMGYLRWKRVIVNACVSWVGFIMGVIAVSSVVQLGIKGILFCLASLLPHMICYVLAYSVFLLYLYRYPSGRWSSAKTIFVVLMLFLGIILETYVSPFLIKLVVRMF